MSKFFIAGLVLFFITYAHAIVNIGVTDLLYTNNAKFQNDPHPTTQIESTTIASIMKFNTEVLSLLRGKLTNLNPGLQETIMESGVFSAYNAESKINAWKIAQPRLLTQWEAESVTLATNETESLSGATPESATTLQLKNNNYILVGWVTSIKAHIDKELIDGTDKKSILYNLDVQVKYKVFDSKTQREITDFEARGHGGYATIVPVSATVANYNPNIAVENAIFSLKQSVRHGLLVKQAQGGLGK